MNETDVVVCGYCGQDIEDRQARVQATCSREECGITTYHSWCVDTYTQRCVKARQVKAGSQHKTKVRRLFQPDNVSNFSKSRNDLFRWRFIYPFQLMAKVKPWKNLELCSKCPAGWYKQNQSLKDMTHQQLEAAQRQGLFKMKPLCPGHVISAQMVEIKAKKGKHRAIKQPTKPVPAPSLTTKTSKKPAIKSSSIATTSQPSPSVAVHATMSLAKTKEFLGISSEDDEDTGHEQTNNNDLIRSLSINSYTEEDLIDGSRNNPHSHTHDIIRSTRSSESPSHSISSYTHSRHVWESGGTSVLTPGEVELAIREGFLPTAYRTTF